MLDHFSVRLFGLSPGCGILVHIYQYSILTGEVCKLVDKGLQFI